MYSYHIAKKYGVGGEKEQVPALNPGGHIPYQTINMRLDEFLDLCCTVYAKFSTTESVFRDSLIHISLVINCYIFTSALVIL